MKKNLLYSYYRIRKIIGLLGLLLPVLVVVIYGGFLSSISDYYYTKSAIVFISILSAFGLFLISYKGYERDVTTERLSDNLITHIGGIAVLCVVIFPTSCPDNYTYLCLSKNYPLIVHNNSIINTIHLISAGVFLFTMGWMSIFRFTKGELTEEKEKKNKIYRFCGYLIWVSVGILIIEFSIKKFFPDFKITNFDVYIFETISVVAFGISWLIKGEAIKDIIDLKNRYF